MPARFTGLITLGLAIVLLLIPYGAAALSGQPDTSLTGLAALHSAAETVYCKDGLTSTGIILVSEIITLLVVVLAAFWKTGMFGILDQALRENGLYMLAGLALAAAPFLVAWGTDSSVCTRGKAFFWESIFVDIFILAILAVSYNLLFGFSGIVSFGHAAFFGTGAYGVGLLMKLAGLPLWGAVLGTLAVGVLIALVKGVVGLRIKGLYFALFTLAFAQVFFLLAGNRLLTNVTGAEDGFSFTVPDWINSTQNRLFFYYFTLAIFVAAFLLVRRFMNSPTGRVLIALRDNESRAQGLGFNTFQFKLIAIVLAGLLATGAGILRGLFLKGASPEVLSLDFTMTPLIMTIVGGQGTFAGPVIGAFGLHLIEEWLRDTSLTLGGLKINIGERWALILGVVFVTSVMVFPYGIVGTWQQRSLSLRQRRSQLIGRLMGKPTASERLESEELK